MSESFLSAKTWWLFSVDKRMGYAEECQETILSGFPGHKPEICLYIGDGNEAVFVFIVSKALSSRFGLSRFIRYLVPFPHGIRSGFQNKLFCAAIQLVLLCESSYFAWENNLISQAKQLDLEPPRNPSQGAIFMPPKSILAELPNAPILKSKVTKVTWPTNLRWLSRVT